MNVAVIGAGTMGSGIGQVFAQYDGCEKVYLCDIKQEFADGGKAKIVKNLEKQVSKGKMDQAKADAIAAKIIPGLKDICGDADLIVEAAIENLQIKQQTFKDLAAICKPDTIFATNTSSLSITAIGYGLDRPVIGMHFFNPAPVMKLVEVNVGFGTPQEIVDKIVDLSKAIGKTPVLVQEGPGFIVNRLMIPEINEAIMIYEQGLASVEDIDVAMELGGNHPMGPLKLGDLIGLDIVLAIMEVLQAETGDCKYRPAMYLKKMVRAGKLGRKTGELS